MPVSAACHWRCLQHCGGPHWFATCAVGQVDGPTLRIATDLAFGALSWNEDVVVDVLASRLRSPRDTVSLERLRGGKGAGDQPLAEAVSTLAVPPPDDGGVHGPQRLVFAAGAAPPLPGMYRFCYTIHGVGGMAGVSDVFVVDGPVVEVASTAVDGWRVV